MVYSVVEFINEKSVAVVPTSWFNVTTSECAWPKKLNNLRRFLEKLEAYNNYDFNLYKARLFKKNIVSLQEATKKCKLYIVASDLSEMENSSAKKRKSRQLGSSSHFITKNKNDKNLQLGKDKKYMDKKVISKKSKISIPQYESSTSNSIISEIDDPNYDKDYNPYKNDKSISAPVSMDDLSCTGAHISVESIDTQQPAIDVDKSQDNFETTIHPKGMKNLDADLFNKINQLDSKVNSIEKQIAGLRYDNRTLSDTLERIEKKLDKLVENGRAETQLPAPGCHVVNFLAQPIKTLELEEDLLDFDKKLIENHEFRLQIIQELTRLLGINIKRSIKRVFEKLFSDKLLSAYSFHGIRSKKSFSSLNICSVIIEAIRKDSMFCHVQDREIEDVIQKYLAQRPFVIKKHEQMSKMQLESKATSNT